MSLEMELEPFKQFVALTAKKRQLEAELAELRKQIDIKKDHLFPFFENDPERHIALDGFTIYQSRQYAAKLADSISREEATKILEKMVPQLVKPAYNANTLSAWVRERIADTGSLEAFMETLSEEMRQVFEIRSWHDIYARAK